MGSCLGLRGTELMSGITPHLHKNKLFCLIFITYLKYKILMNLKKKIMLVIYLKFTNFIEIKKKKLFVINLKFY
jgi:hypothetical protein